MGALDRLLGTWEISMHHSAMSEPVSGRQRYERVLDGAFVLQYWTYDHPDFPHAIESTGEMSYDNGASWQPDFTMTYKRVS